MSKTNDNAIKISRRALITGVASTVAASALSTSSVALNKTNDKIDLRAIAKPPKPPFTKETAMQKVRAAEDGWNSRDHL